MDEHNQKPTDEMLAEARRLAFFADEVFSQDIMNSYEETEKYIKRHTKTLIEQGTIKPKIKYYAYTPEEIKAYNKWFNSICWKAVYFPILIYLFLSWYFISTPMDNWIFNLGQYNTLLLQWFPKAQYWVNISTDHREKMILLYVIYTFFYWLIFTLIIYQIVTNVKKFTSEYVPTKAKLCGNVGVGLMGVCLCLLLFFFGFSGGFVKGSDVFLMPYELDNSNRQWMFRDNSRWNTIIGFLFAKSLSLFSLLFLLFAVRLPAAMWFCKKA